ncbi:MAG TPA: contractile injection system tape measure protein [Acetobacteraceae bacterium]|jgi:hypothetical protein|nr:contractile injection system tape measure protein [Acetobacteraceae bacterium]
MPAQRHAIRRQIIELRVRDATEAARLSPVMAALVQDRIMPILDRCFSAASDPERVDRIDRLELDLGRLYSARLAEDLATRVEARLPAALRQATPARSGAARAGTGSAGAEPAEAGPESAALLLIGQFARTGGLPWWSDARTLRTLDEAVETAHRATPHALAALLRGLAADRRAIERLVLHQSDAGLEQLLSLLAPAAVALPNQLGPLLAEAPALAAIGPLRLRRLLWREALSAALGGAADDGALLEALLTNLASAAGTTLALLLADLQAGGLSQQDGLGARIAVLAARFPPPVATATPETDLLALFDRAASRAPALHPLLELLRPLAARLPAPDRDACAAALDTLSRPGIGTEDAAAARAVGALLRPFTRAALVTMATLSPMLAPLEQYSEPPARPRAVPPTRTAADDEPARYVENAGLCLLWPFLGRFLARLGLLAADETGFAREPARHRAVGLLHHVATGEREAPEFWLALNKVLCGLDLDALEVFGPPVTDAEAQETDGLLAAVIAHAGCLGAISADGFRGSFLLRRGALSTRDGAWLLRVERQAADVLRERFPWSTEWIRLPWMRAPLRVEW